MAQMVVKGKSIEVTAALHNYVEEKLGIFMYVRRMSGVLEIAHGTITEAGQHPVYQVEVAPFHNAILHTRHDRAALLGEPFGVVLNEVFGVFPCGHIQSFLYILAEIIS